MSCSEGSPTHTGAYHFERYDLLARVHEGPHGEVWRAQPRLPEPAQAPVGDDHDHDHDHDDLFAPPSVLIKLPADELGRQRVVREVEALSLLAGADETVRSTLVPLHDANLECEQPYSVLRQPLAPCLLTRIDRRGKVDEANVATMLGDVLRALTHAHARGVIHGAITPGCIFVDAGYNASLADFGFGPIAGQASAMETGVATPQALAQRCVLPASGEDDQWIPLEEFLAPEAARAGLIHPGTDLYALGRVAAYALIGGPARRSLEMLLERARISWSLRRIVATLCDLDPQERYGSAAEALAVVEAIFLNRTINPAFAALGSGALPSESEQGARLARRNEQRLRTERPTKQRTTRTLLLFLVLAMLLAAPLVLTAIFSSGSDDTSGEPPATVPGNNR